jgi:Zeta toxin
MYGQGGALEKTPEGLSRYLDDLTVLKIAKAYLRRQSDVTMRGKAVVVTAGPPGAGKSEALREQGYQGYRLIDPDIVKDLLLDDANRHGFLDYRHGLTLPDGGDVAPRELATHVHHASTRIADLVRDTALKLGENVIIDGSLSWEKLPGQYIEEFSRAGYEGLSVVSVEAPLDLATERARGRWWSGRKEGGLGGRFVPDAVVAVSFDEDGSSRCARNARELAERGQEELGDSKLIRYYIDPQTGGLNSVSGTD